MNRFHPFTLQSLESRTLLSAAPHFHLPGFAKHVKDLPPNPILAADMQKLKDDLAKFNADQQSWALTLAADNSQLAADRAKLMGDLQPLREQRAADEAQWKATLDADKAAIEAAEENPDAAANLDALRAQLAADQAAAHTAMEVT